jgi:hypothetical protein
MEPGTEARRGLGPAWVAIALGVLVALALVDTSRSEGAPGQPLAQPLELERFRAIGSRDSAVAVEVVVRNTRDVDVEVLDASIPDMGDVRFGSGTAAPTSLVRAHDYGRFAMRLPTVCPTPPAIDRIDVRLRIEGHEQSQSLRFLNTVRWQCR